ncbi:hypothetical protein GCM10010348_78710 [Streptomyces anthocyanicus]|nr:hypothetical protein GCM10010348_78710 [Streptomyces anthocyanicus]
MIAAMMATAAPMMIALVRDFFGAVVGGKSGMGGVGWLMVPPRNLVRGCMMAACGDDVKAESLFRDPNRQIHRHRADGPGRLLSWRSG